MAKANTKTESKTETKKVPAEVIRKITNKDVLGDISVPKEETPLYTLMGNIYGYDTGNTTYGDYIKFKGDFIAVTKDGKEFRAPYAIIPTPMDLALAGQFDSAVEALADPETGEIPKGKRAQCEMAIEIGVKPADTPTKYQWTMKPLIEIAPTNALDSLKERVLLLGND